jgi:hypothetical protein
MNGLPHPNIQLKPGQELSPSELVALSKKIQENFDYLARKLK